MKNFTGKLFIFSAFLLIGIQCSKDTPNPNQEFIIGQCDNNSLSYQTYNPPIEILSDPHGYVNQEIDVNNDGENDFNLISEHPISPGGINSKRALIEPLHSQIEIAIIEKPDTLHKCTVIYGDTIFVYTYYNSDTLYQCPEADSINIINKNWPQIFQYGDELNTNIVWSNDVLEFASNDETSYSWFENGIIYNTSYKIKHCFWNNIGEKFIVFMFRKNEKYYYGWMKLSIFDYKGIKIHEIAYQKY
ncbi:MAG: hypothetical protein ISS18_16040 [Bacteroidales bacterium]|nr:hypothetical protein [Bacteroidales bacterium]